MNIEHLNYLVTVADCGSIHEASRQLLFKQQYLSNVIKSLEEHFGTQIFERHPRGVVPTANGQFLIDTARQIVALYNTMENDFAYPDNLQEQDCHDTVNIYTSVYLSTDRFYPLLEEIKTYFPNLQVSLLSKSTKDFFATLYEEPTSLVLYPTHVSAEVFQATLPADLSFHSLESVPFGLLTSKNNKEAEKYDVISIKDALNLPLVFLAPQDLASAPIYQMICTFGKPNTQYIVDNPALLIQLLNNKPWYAIANRHILASNQALIDIPFKEPVTLNLFLVYHKDAPQSYVLRSLIRLLRTSLGSLLE